MRRWPSRRDPRRRGHVARLEVAIFAAEPSAPRLFAVPPGADFPRLLARGLLARAEGATPEALARVEIFVNTRRMQRRLREALAEDGARLLPRLRLVSDAGLAGPPGGLTPPVPPLRRRLELMQFVARLIEADPGIAPAEAAYDLADSLAALMDEMQEEGVEPAALAALDVSGHAHHWQRSLRFIELVQRYFDAESTPDARAHQRRAIETLAARWRSEPPAHPVIVAGSTGSRGTTALLMRAVAALPQGALVLPGFDFDMPEAVWAGMDDAMTAEDHPQYRFHRLLRALGAAPGDVRPWLPGAQAPSPARNRLISLALRPAPVTDQWMAEGRHLHALADACAEMSLVEAASPREEALAIALRLRKAAQDDTAAALITLDRDLARRVSAALDRWGLRPDDSAGRPLALTAPGRLLRHISELSGQTLSAQGLVTLLKHPLVHSGAGRGDHLRHSRDLELHLRRRGPAFPDRAALARWAGKHGGPGAADWADWLGAAIEALAEPDTDEKRPLRAHVTRHRALAERLAAGTEGVESPELWRTEAGEQALRVMQELEREAGHGGELAAMGYASFFAALLRGREVRETVTAHPRVMIWGTLEARVQGADLVILGGLNDGVWPQLPEPDPWLNRQMRRDAGLLLPERRIGLSAHDFQQAIGAPEVMLTRSLRGGEAPSVPSRWLNRLVNLLGGLPAQGGADALGAMRARGQRWLKQAQALEADYRRVAPAPRPAPAPPAAARPRQLPVTAIETLIRDPYAVYAGRILRLRPLDPLHPRPDAALRGKVIHRIMERFVRERPAEEPREAARTRLQALVEECLAAWVPWPAARRQWAARFANAADWLLDWEQGRDGRPVLLEREGAITLPAHDFTLTARPDRIDERADGTLEIIDYKTGAPPKRKEQMHFAKQLLLEAAMVRRGAFADLGAREVARVIYLGLGTTPSEVASDYSEEDDAETWAGLERLIGAYLDPAQGYTARRAPRSDRIEGDHDHLARRGEWETSAAPVTLPVGREET